MGLLSWVGETVADGYYAVGDIASDAISATYNTVADTVDVIGDCIETAAEVANDAIDFTGDVIEAGMDVVGDVAEATLDVAGDVVEGTLDVAGDIVEGAADLVGDAANLTTDWIGKGIQGTTDVGGDILDSVFSFVGAEKIGAAINNSLDSMGTTVADGMDGLGDALNQTADGLGKFTNTVADGVGAMADDAFDLTGKGVNTLADAAGKGTNTLLDATGDAIEILGKGTNLGLDIAAKYIKVKGIVLSNIVRFSYAKKAFFAAIIVGSPKAKCILTHYASDTAGSLAGEIFDLLGEDNLEEVLKFLANKTKKDPKEVCGDNIGECDGEKLDTKACGGSASGPIVSDKCQGNANLESIYYVNGIQTKKNDACETTKILSKKTCSKVTGIYNATEGIGADLRESIENIKRNSTAPAMEMLHTEIVDKLLLNDPPEKVIVFAHSQGGLITQEALKRVKADLIFFYDDGTPEGAAEIEKRLAMIEVKSFGTATNGWIKGPSYEHYTNECDLVPKVIQNIQDKMSCYNGKFDDTPTHSFNDCEYWDPIAPHSMDDVYIDQYVMQHGECECYEE